MAVATLSANCPIILISVTVYRSNQQLCRFLKPHSFHCHSPFNCINRNFRNYFLALKQIKCWWYNKIHDCKNFFGSFMFAFQIKSKNAHMIKIIVCTTMKQFNRANRFKRFFVNNCLSDKPFGWIGTEPKINGLSHSLFIWVIEIVSMAIITVEKRQCIFITIYTYKILSVIRLRKSQEKSIIFKSWTVFIYIWHLIAPSKNSMYCSIC